MHRIPQVVGPCVGKRTGVACPEPGQPTGCGAHLEGRRVPRTVRPMPPGANASPDRFAYRAGYSHGDQRFAFSTGWRQA